MVTTDTAAAADTAGGMAVSELSRRSGLSVATIKFYIREGLLPAGHATSRTRATYDHSHLTRLRLIRALLEVGGVSLAAAKSVIDVVHAGADDSDDIVRNAIHALGPDAPGPADDAFHEARADVEALLGTMGWQVDLQAPAVDMLAASLRALRATYGPVPAEAVAKDAAAAHAVATTEFSVRPPTDDPATLVEWAVTGTVAFEQALIAWRRLAHEDLAARHRMQKGLAETN